MRPTPVGDEEAPTWLPAPLADLYKRPQIHKFFKYSTTSLVCEVLGQSQIFVYVSILNWSWGWANVTAVVTTTLPAYYMSRAWVWRKTGKSNLYTEVIPFWVLSFLGLVLSTIAVVILESRYPDTKILANLGDEAGYGVLWIAKFFILDRVLFKVAREHPEDVGASPIAPELSS